MNNNELDEIWESIEEIIYSPTKKDAKKLIDRLNFKVNNMQQYINDPYLFNKLKDVIIYAEEASGRVSNKTHWKYCAEQSWYTFQTGIRHNKNED